MAISPEILEQVRAKIDLVELVRTYLPDLRRSGRNFKVLCPFHSEKTPSFVVNPEKSIFHCFGCGVGGDIFSFLMQMENITFSEAVRKLAKRCGVEIKEEVTNGRLREINREKSLLYQLYEESSCIFHQYLAESDEANPVRKYLNKRGISEETVKSFRLGYAPVRDKILRENLEKKGYSLEQLIKSGLFGFSETQGKHYSLFRGRLIFPIFDTQGRVIAFGGRILEEAMDSTSQLSNGITHSPKYLNSPETLIFSKSKALYGLAQAIKIIRSENQAIMCEGYFDVLIMHQVGIRNAVASLGTALTKEQVQILQRYTNRVLLIFDSDRAGVEAMERSGENLVGLGKTIAGGLSLKDIEIPIETGLEMKVVLLPGQCDPDEILQTEGEIFFLNLIKEAKELFEFQIEQTINRRGISSQQDRIALAKEILPLITKVRDTLEEQARLRYLARRLDLDEGLLNAEVRRLRKKSKETSFLEVSNIVSGSPEEELLSLLLQDPKLISLVVNKINSEDFSYPRCVRLAEVIFELNEKLTPSYLLDLFGEENNSWITKLVCQEKQWQDKEKVALGLVFTIQRRRQEQRWKNLQEEIKSMLEGGMPLDQKKYEEYQQLTKTLKGSVTNSQLGKSGSITEEYTVN